MGCILFWLFPYSSFAWNCADLVVSLNGSRSLARHARAAEVAFEWARVEKILSTLLVAGPRRPINGYSDLLIPIGGPSTLHGIDETGVWTKNDDPVTDTLFALNLPPENQTTVWQMLSSYERGLLVEHLALYFSRGRYDERFLQHWITNPLKLALDTSFHAGDHGDTPIYGISPTQLIRSADRGNSSGVCRQGNLALVGLLMELGATPDYVVAVAGSDSNDRHMWTEYRTGLNDKWLAVDATPYSNRESSIDHLRWMSANGFRSRFPYDIIVHEAFAVSIDSALRCQREVVRARYRLSD